MDHAHATGTILLQAIALALGMNDTFAFSAHHRPNQPSTSAMGLLKYSPLCGNRVNLGHSAHTDVGTLTILFNRLPGLQILPDGAPEWPDILPRPGHAIINVGDSLRFMTDNHIALCLHRVVPSGGQNVMERLSCAYFLRPEIEAPLCVESGERMSSIEHHMRKYGAFRAPSVKQSKDSTLTGRSGYLGLWDQEKMKLVSGC